MVKRRSAQEKRSKLEEKDCLTTRPPHEAIPERFMGAVAHWPPHEAIPERFMGAVAHFCTFEARPRLAQSHHHLGAQRLRSETDHLEEQLRRNRHCSSELYMKLACLYSRKDREFKKWCALLSALKLTHSFL